MWLFSFGWHVNFIDAGNRGLESPWGILSSPWFLVNIAMGVTKYYNGRMLHFQHLIFNTKAIWFFITHLKTTSLSRPSLLLFSVSRAKAAILKNFWIFEVILQNKTRKFLIHKKSYKGESTNYGFLLRKVRIKSEIKIALGLVANFTVVCCWS